MTIPPSLEDTASETEDKPPLFSSWNGWYLLIMGTLVALIIVFYLFSNSYQ